MPVAVDEESVSAAAAILAEDGLVCFPTDTVYAIGGLAESATARDRFYRAKQRPADQPAVLMVQSPGKSVKHRFAKAWVELDARAIELIDVFWPGPLTLVLRASPLAVRALGQVVREGTLGIRVPDDSVALSLLRAVGRPLVTSSANPAGQPPPVTGQEAAGLMGDRVDMVLDGACVFGRASSILDLTGGEPRVIREGAIPAERLLS